MRKALVTSVTALALASACGMHAPTHHAGPATLTSGYGSVLRAAVVKTQSTSSRIAMTVSTHLPQGDVSIVASGVTSAVTGVGPEGDITVSALGQSIEERIVDGRLFMHLGSQAGWYVLSLSDLVGTSLATSSNPGSASSVLAAAGNDVHTLGTSTVRGVKVTHYYGTIAVKLDPRFGGVIKAAIQSLIKSGVKSLPFDAYLDAQGRMRKLTETVDTTVKGQPISVTTNVEQYDYGVPVHVVAPPVSQQKDGSELLKRLKG
jgi:hypothetical protein